MLIRYSSYYVRVISPIARRCTKVRGKGTHDARANSVCGYSIDTSRIRRDNAPMPTTTTANPLDFDQFNRLLELRDNPPDDLSSVLLDEIRDDNPPRE